ncbi:MAG: hypothetical protein V1682_05315 [Candidatus Omnitrophota bacterium]
MMKRLILTDSYSFIKRHFSPKDVENGRFFVLNADKASLDIKRYLSETVHMGEVTKKEMNRIFGERFKKEFSQAIYRSNKENYSTFWWAMSFTNKHPIVSKLCEDAFCFAAIRELFAGHKDLSLIVITDRAPLAMQLRRWSKDNDIDLIRRISFRMDTGLFLRLHTPLVILYMFFKLMLRKLTARALLKGPDRRAGQPVIFSEFDDRSIDPEGLYSEIYFKGLKNTLNERRGMGGVPNLTVGFSPYFGPIRFYGFCRSLKRNKENAGVYPIEYFLPIHVLAKHLFTSLARSVIPVVFKGRFEIFGEDASELLQYEISKSVGSGQTLLNLSIHAAASFFSKRYKPAAIYYPFENRSWEKMVVMACRERSEKTKLIGYQHTIIALKNLCYYLEEGEHAEIPMPDMVITVGEVTNNIMRRWNFPSHMLKTGCALRVLARRPEKPQARKRAIKEILVALAFGRDEYVKMMIFLENAFAAADGYDIVLRPHPAVSLDSALEIFKPKRMKYRVSIGTLREDLERCDLVLYASSTVALEAVSMGKPAIFIELDDFINSDPMFDMDALKWRCGNAARLKDLIGTIDKMSEEEFRGMKDKASAYTKKYFYPVNRENLAAFLA